MKIYVSPAVVLGLHIPAKSTHLSCPIALEQLFQVEIATHKSKNLQKGIKINARFNTQEAKGRCNLKVLYGFILRILISRNCLKWKSRMAEEKNYFQTRKVFQAKSKKKN